MPNTDPIAGERGLKAAEPDHEFQDQDLRFHLHILIPCYKEDVSIVRKTVLGALEADLPAHTKRTVYLCDDNNYRADPENEEPNPKKNFIESLVAQGNSCVYVNGRKRKLGERNGKSNNLNNCIRNHIYPHLQVEVDLRKQEASAGPGGPQPQTEPALAYEHIDRRDLIVVFDSDMVANKDAFLRLLEVMADSKIDLCLTPQAFHNIHQAIDLFNNINIQFWEYWLPGASAQGYIACTGTNFCIRARSLAHVGLFPDYTITEDYALGMELKRHGYNGAYLLAYIAKGEAPDEIRNVFRQRSRWCKGHFQVLFSWKHCPLFLRGLPFAQRLWYCYGTYSYIATVTTTPTFLLVPFLGIVFGLYPAVINYWFAAATTVYFLSTYMVQSYVRISDHVTGMWFSGISNQVLCFTFFKAICNVLISGTGWKQVGFKVTDKTKTQGPHLAGQITQAAKALTSNMKNTLSRVGSRLRTTKRTGSVGQELVPLHESEQSDDSQRETRGVGTSRLGPGARDAETQPLLPTVISGETAKHPRPSKAPEGGEPTTPPKKKRGLKQYMPKLKNAGNIFSVLDPMVLVIAFLICLATIGCGIYRIARPTPDFNFAYVGVPMAWAVYNMVPYYLFIHYCFTSDKSFAIACRLGRLLQTVAGLTSIILLWITVPMEFNLKHALDLTVDSFGAARSGALAPDASIGVPQWRGASALGDSVTGGFYTDGTHVKAAIPISLSVAMLSWAYLEFPHGMKGGTQRELVQHVRFGADYLASCLTERNGVRGYIAQIGRPQDYAVDPLDPDQRGALWTRPETDPLLSQSHHVNRTEYFIDPSSPGGEDVLGSAMAGLAAAATVMKVQRDMGAYNKYLDAARELYSMARRGRGSEKPFCDRFSNDTSPPCTFQTHRLVQKRVTNTTLELLPLCYVPDENQKTCIPKLTIDECNQGLINIKKRKFARTPEECCDYLTSIRKVTYGETKYGVCALPKGQTACYIPDLTLGTCRRESLELNGTGCMGLGLEIYSTATACCNRLPKLEGTTKTFFTDADECRIKLDKCWLPVVSKGDCEEFSGNDCNGSGFDGVFTTQAACCNRLIDKVGGVKVAVASLLATSKCLNGSSLRMSASLSDVPPSPDLPPFPPSPPSPPFPPSPPSPPGRRKLQQQTDQRFRTKVPKGPNQTTVEYNTTVEVVTEEFYYSKNVYDDLAWGSAWLYRATKNALFLGSAQEYLLDHYTYEIRPDTLTTDRDYFRANETNLVWHANVLLNEMTNSDDYRNMTDIFLKAWQGFPLRDKEQQHKIEQQEKLVAAPPMRETDVVLLPNGDVCEIRELRETNCYNDKDDDCDGLTDTDDPDCPFTPVRYTSNHLAWTPDQPLHHAAHAAWLAVVHAQHADYNAAKRRLARCWGLGQVRFILGSSGRSYLVGFGGNFPKQSQHRGASCATNLPDEGVCDWFSGFYPNEDNPNVLRGGVVAGPDLKQRYYDIRSHPNSRVSLSASGALLGVLAGTIQNDISIQICQSFAGVYQDVFMKPAI